PDCHALAIQPGTVPPVKPPKPEDKNKPPKPPVCQRVLLGTDGGLYQSFAGGKNWDHLNRFPAGEFYRISLDDTKPYFRIAGGLQDNENWVGPSGVQSKERIRNCDWTALAGGDGFYVLFDPTDRDTFYAESQQGEVHRINLRNGEIRRLRPEPAEGQPRYRFHWNSLMIMSRHKPGVMYLGGNWMELTHSLPEAEPGQWNERIEPSKNDPNVEYDATNAYHSDEDRPKILRTAEQGKTWQSVKGDLPQGNPVEVVREDPVNPKLLYAGTHFGVFVSFDQGAHWVRIGDVPSVRADDIQIHPRTSDLVIATHGRSIAILDDTIPFREFTTEIACNPAQLLSVRSVSGAYLQPGFVDSNGKGIYRGQNPPEGALFTVWVREFTGDEIKIVV